MNLISILPTSTYRLHMGCFFQFSRQTQQKSKLQLSHLTLLHPSVFRRFCPHLGQGLTWLIKKAKNPTSLSVILAHFSPHFSHSRQETGACPINPRHSQQKKCPCPQSTLCENLILQPEAVVSLLLLLLLSGT